jgi:toxin ParE1/3/4
MPLTVRLSADAVSDLQGISDYTLHQWGKEQEPFYLTQVYARFEEISRDPARFRQREELFAGCRVAPVGRHLVFFLMRDDVIVVSRILHQAMDFPRHLFPDW